MDAWTDKSEEESNAKKSMDAELLKKARAVMQRVRVDLAVQAPAVEIHTGPPATDAAIEKQDSVVTARAILAEHDEADAIRIMDLWRRLFAFSESREHIASQLRALRQWQSKKPQVSA